MFVEIRLDCYSFIECIVDTDSQESRVFRQILDSAERYTRFIQFKSSSPKIQRDFAISYVSLAAATEHFPSMKFWRRPEFYITYPKRKLVLLAY